MSLRRKPWVTVMVAHLFLFSLTPRGLHADVKTSKAMTYSVIGPVYGAQAVSKVSTYSVIGPVFGAQAVSKVNTYSVIGPVSGTQSVSKVNTYSVIGPVQGAEAVSKVTTYSVIGPVAGAQAVSKVVVYSVLYVPDNSKSQPSVFIITKDNRIPRLLREGIKSPDIIESISELNISRHRITSDVPKFGDHGKD